MKVTESARVHRFRELVAVDFKNPDTETLYLSERAAFQVGHVLAEYSADVQRKTFQESTLGTVTIQGSAESKAKPKQDTDENKRRLLGRLSGLATFLESDRLWLLAKFPTDGADMADAIREEAESIPGALALADEFEAEQ